MTGACHLHAYRRATFWRPPQGLLAPTGRVALTVLGTVIGVGALVATIGLSKTAGNQIVGRFSEVAATDVVVTPVPGALGGNAASEAIPGTPRPARCLNGVAEAEPSPTSPCGGRSCDRSRSTIRLARPTYSCRSRRRPRALARQRAQLTAAVDAGIGLADQAGRAGRTPPWRSASRIADQQPAIFRRPAGQVSGLVASAERQSPADRAPATIPNGTARREFARRARFGAGGDRHRHVEVVARQAPKALSPTDPALLRVAARRIPRRYAPESRTT